MKKLISLALAGCMVCSLAACGSSSSASEPASSAAAGETLTGKGQGFGGVITATVTVDGDTITGVTFDGPDETPDVGGAALETIAQQMVDAGSAEVDGVSGATYTTEGCIAAVQNAMDPEGHPFEEADAETTEWPTGDEPVEIPSDRKIVSASTYGMYTKSPDSDQDAVIGATLYWDLDNDECYAIRFTEPVTPFMDTGATSGWACVQDADVLAALGDNVVHLSIPATEYGDAVEADYAKYIQIGDVVWTGEAGSTPGSDVAVVYAADIDGQNVTLFDYCSTEEGGKWYVEATADQPAYLLTTPEVATSEDAANVAQVCEVKTKENSGHGVDFWSSPITFPGNIQLLKDFAVETNFSYGYYADGGLSQNEDGYWQTPDAVSGATISEGCTYLDMLKTLYDRIQNGEYVEMN